MRTSPYAFYQFWLGTADADVYRFLKYFTFLSVVDIDAIEQADAERDGRPEAQSILAAEVTRLVHGREGLDAAKRITEALFSGSLVDLSESDMRQLRQDGLPASSLGVEAFPETLIQLLTDVGMAGSGKQVKDALGRGAVRVNDRGLKMEDNGNPAGCFLPGEAIHGRFYLVKLGKKKYHLFEIGVEH